MKCTAALAITAVLMAEAALAQWEQRPDRLIPRLASGEPDLTAPTPRDASGRPDLSGVWFPDAEPVPENIPTVEIDFEVHPAMIDITAGIPPEDVQILPWAAELVAEREANRGMDSPQAHCKPSGVPWLNAIVLPYKIIQTPELVVILYEENVDYRQIFLDDRSSVEDPAPRWMGYSTGRWEGDELVVESTGFTEDMWLDGMGHPLTSSMRLIERFRRPDAGHLEIETTIDDPGTYAKPLTYTVTATAFADDDLLEYFCTENEKSSAHYQ